MSSIVMSSSNFQSILDAALDNYSNQTGINLINHPSAEQIQNCQSPDDVLKLLLERESAFKDYRDKYRNFIGSLRPIVQAVHAFSSILGEAAGLVSSAHSILLFGSCLYTSLQVPFQPTKAIFIGIDVLISVRILVLSIGLVCDIYQHQAAIGVSGSYDALGELFECVGYFLTRLHIYTEKISSSPAMSDIMVKIMVQVINVLALATKQIKQGRFS
jgi:hypothetical protein